MTLGDHQAPQRLCRRAARAVVHQRLSVSYCQLLCHTHAVSHEIYAQQLAACCSETAERHNMRRGSLPVRMLWCPIVFEYRAASCPGVRSETASALASQWHVA